MGNKDFLYMDLVKTMIQQSLWSMWERTKNEEYKKLYENWYDNYEKITIDGLR